MLHYSPFDMQTIRDPYPLYKEMRSRAPLYISEEEGFVAVSRHDDVVHILRDSQSFSSEKGVTLHPVDRAPQDLPFPVLVSDPPEEHKALKQRLLARFKPSPSRKMRDRFASNARDILHRFSINQRVDIVRDFVEPYAIACFADLAEVGEDRIAAFTRILELALERDPSDPRSTSAPSMGYGAMEGEQGSLADFMLSHVSGMRRRPEGCPYTGSISAGGTWDGLADKEVAGVAYIATIAGIEDVVRTIAGSLPLLSGLPAATIEDVIARRFDDRFVDEASRLVSSTQYLRRTAGRDIALYDRRIPAGTRIVAILGAANRDERIFPDPDKFNDGRPNLNQVLSFGFGSHMCIGFNFARNMISAALEQLHALFPRYEIESETSVMAHSFNVVGIYSLRAVLR